MLWLWAAEVAMGGAFTTTARVQCKPTLGTQGTEMAKNLGGTLLAEFFRLGTTAMSVVSLP